MDKRTFYINIDIQNMEEVTPLKIAKAIRNQLSETLELDFPQPFEENFKDSNDFKILIIPLPYPDGTFSKADIVVHPCIRFVICNLDKDRNLRESPPTDAYTDITGLFLGIFDETTLLGNNSTPCGFTGSFPNPTCSYSSYWKTSNDNRDNHGRNGFSYENKIFSFSDYYSSYNGLCDNIYLKIDTSNMPNFYKIGFAINHNGNMPFTNALRIASPGYVINYTNRKTGKKFPGWFFSMGSNKDNSSGYYQYHFVNIFGANSIYLNKLTLPSQYNISKGLTLYPIAIGDYTIENFYLVDGKGSGFNAVARIGLENQTDSTFFDGILHNDETYLYSSGDGDNEGVIVLIKQENSEGGE